MTRAEARAAALGIVIDAALAEGAWMVEVGRRRGRFDGPEAAAVQWQLGVVLRWLDRVMCRGADRTGA